jgi:hypothetical protein
MEEQGCQLLRPTRREYQTQPGTAISKPVHAGDNRQCGIAVGQPNYSGGARRYVFKSRQAGQPFGSQPHLLEVRHQRRGRAAYNCDERERVASRGENHHLGLGECKEWTSVAVAKSSAVLAGNNASLRVATH